MTWVINTNTYLIVIITWFSWILDSDWSIQNTWHIVIPEQTDRCQGFMTVVKDAQICRKKSRSLRFASGSWSACQCSFPHNDQVAAHYPLLSSWLFFLRVLYEYFMKSWVLKTHSHVSDLKGKPKIMFYKCFKKVYKSMR